MAGWPRSVGPVEERATYGSEPARIRFESCPPSGRAWVASPPVAVMAVTNARGRGWCRGAPIVAALLVLAGCTYSEREPGLLDRETPQPSVGPPSSTSTPTATPLPATNPELPVAGESVWTSADGLDVQVRFAVHAVRRVDGGTVLDWSVTPIRAANLRPGDAVPDSVDLGLSRRWESSANVLLVDAPGQGRSTGRWYAPRTPTTACVRRSGCRSAASASASPRCCRLPSPSSRTPCARSM